MYEMMPPQPTQFVPPPKKRMSVLQIVLIAVTIAVLAVVLIIRTASCSSEQYDFISAGTIGARYSGDCLIVRNETPFEAEGVTSVDYVAEEGTLVSMGETVCNVFSSGFSTREMTTLQEYRDQIKEYQTKLLKSEIATDVQLEKLESDVMTRAREVRKIIAGARGNMGNQEVLLNEAIEARQNYLREKYSNDQRMTRLYDDEQSQLQRISSWTKQYAALSAGIVSFYSDGYEYGLTVNNFDQFTPAEVRNMINGNKPVRDTAQKGKTTIYRLVRDGSWYVLMLIRDSNWNPVEGNEYELRLENFKDTTVNAKVLSYTRTGGELLVRLSIQSQVAPVLYVRTCTGIIGDDTASLTVPKKAIHTQENTKGIVWIDDNGNEWFIPVNVIDERDGICYIAPIQQGAIYEGQKVKLFN